ncbi:MAG TPA: TetR/AcrR family transcriptional regulator [Thermomicrobiales bacterium]|nr:TetR/AcrR family transcriptional regulator [Thermomicrobiales bacterium]
MVIRDSEPHPHTRKEQIYETASALFSRNGYRSTSVRDIARQLDLQGGSLYAHITSKEQVLWEIVSRVAESFDAAVRPIAESDGPAPDRLRRMIHAHIDVLVQHFSHATVFFQDWRHLGGERRAEVINLRDRYEALFRQVIVDGVATGQFAERDPRLAAIFLLTAMNGIPGWYRSDGERAAEDVANAFAEMLLSGLIATNRVNAQKGSSA